MLTAIPLLTLLMFSIAYPLCFWLSLRDPLKKNFHHFHIGLPNVTAGLTVFGMFFLGMPNHILFKAYVWLGLFFLMTYVYWKKETVNPAIVTVVSLFGFIVYVKAHIFLLGLSVPAVIACVLGGLVLSSALYAMNLGHWYLNVHGLPLIHLKRATAALGIFLVIRLIWDLVIFLGTRVMHRGELSNLFRFVSHMEGIFLLVAFFFGTLFPLVSIYFVWGTLKAKSTQSATGILYVLLSAILIGDIAYKYYLLNYQLPF